MCCDYFRVTSLFRFVYYSSRFFQNSLFIKENYYPGCSLKNKTPAIQEGVYDIELKTTGPDAPEDEVCFINYASVLKYAPDIQKAVQWNLGQDTNFWNGTESYDLEMIESFRFLNL